MQESVLIWGQCGEFALTRSAWNVLLTVGAAYGWQGSGTTPAPYELLTSEEVLAWDGRYEPCDGQEVTREDAWRLAAALERALPDLFDPHALSRIKGFIDVRDELCEWIPDFIYHCRGCSPFLLY